MNKISLATGLVISTLAVITPAANAAGSADVFVGQNTPVAKKAKSKKSHVGIRVDKVCIGAGIIEAITGKKPNGPYCYTPSKKRDAALAADAERERKATAERNRLEAEALANASR